MTSHRTTVLGVLFLALASAISGCASRDIATGSEGALSSRPYFELWQADGGDYYFHLRAANHETILSSEGYSTRTSALGGLLSVLDNGVLRARYELRPASTGEWYFVLKAGNGRVIGMSERYATRTGAATGIDAVERNVNDYQDFLANRHGARFEVFRGADGRFYFDLFAQNGEIVLRSQGYSAEASAWNATFSVADNGVDASRYDVRDAADGSSYFNLKAANGAVIGTSETYASRSNAERGRDAIIALLPTIDML